MVKKRRGYKVLPLAEELLAIDSCWEGHSVFLKGVALGRVDHIPEEGHTSKDL